MKTNIFFIAFILLFSLAEAKSIELGIDRLFSPNYIELIRGKKIGLVSHHSAVNQERKSSFTIFSEKKDVCNLTTLFTLEHGFYGSIFVDTEIKEDHLFPGYRMYSLQGAHQKLTSEMIQDLDLIVYDVQDIGVRSYTFIHVLFKVLVGASHLHIPVIILDRPNPMGGEMIDGPLQQMFTDSDLSGTCGLPYCHGMTVGELAQFFKDKHQLSVSLDVIPMKGWTRCTLFRDTGLPWIPTSPQIPESDSAFFYATTGLIGHLSLTSIGVGYTLPFKVLGAPWINAADLARTLNEQKLSGIIFLPYRYEPFFGKYKMEECQGVFLSITDPHIFRPVETQFVILGILKTLYPKMFMTALQVLKKLPSKSDTFNELVGSDQILKIILHDRYIAWPLREICRKSREAFALTRADYLLPDYSICEFSS